MHFCRSTKIKIAASPAFYCRLKSSKICLNTSAALCGAANTKMHFLNLRLIFANLCWAQILGRWFNMKSREYDKSSRNLNANISMVSIFPIWPGSAVIILGSYFYLWVIVMPVPLYPHHSFATVLLPSSRQLERSQDLSLSLAPATWLEFFTNNGPLSFLSVGMVKSYRVTVSPPSHPNHHRDWGLTGLWDHPGKLQLPSFGSHIGPDVIDMFRTRFSPAFD